MKQLSKNTSTLLFIFLTGVLVVVAFISYNKILQFNKSVDAMMLSNEVKNNIIELVSELKDAEIGQSDYLLTDDSVFLQPFNDSEQRSNRLFAALDSLIKDNPPQLENLTKLKILVDEKFFILNTNLNLFKNTPTNLFHVSALFKGKNKMDEIREHAALMLQTEDAILQQRTLVKDRTASITPFFLLVLSLFSIFVITLFFFRLQKETSKRILITESNMLLQEANQLIEASEKRFRTLSETVPHMIWTATPDGNKNSFNQYFLDYTGLSFDELKGDGWQSIIFPDDLEKELQQWYKSLNTGEDFKIEKRVLHHSGTFQWHLSHGKAQKNNEGNIIGWIGTSTEIEDQKKIEEELEIKVQERTKELLVRNQTFELAESIAKLGSYSWNTTTDALEYSDNLFRLLDCEPQEFVPSIKKFSTFIHPDDLQQVASNRERTTQTGILVESPYRIISKTGTIKHFRSSGTFSGEGHNRLLIGTVQDISEDVAASKELKAKNLELENTNAELASFSYIASHDLQEPLRKIQGFSKRIIDKEAEHLSDTTKDYFNRIISAAQRMQNLIESLISFSRTSLTDAIFEKTDLNQTLIEVQTDLNELLSRKNAVIESQTLPTINAVPVQMHQLFLNLIGNSLKYSKCDDPPHITITAEKVTINDDAEAKKQNGTFWKIVFSDNGIGFEQQYENKIFELFQRLHGKTEYEGTGIGLAICKKIVQTHNGTITATGHSGIGSTFTIFLSDN